MSPSPQSSMRRAIVRPRFGYNLSQLLDFPRRLLFPPEAGVGVVRSLKVVPKYDVTLNDVLDGKHLPPLTLKDFEEYLVFVERSPENLYFICWLREYNIQYAKWERSIAHLPEDKRPKSLPGLTLSFARARATFLNNQSYLELNLPSEVVNETLDAAKLYAHPPPAALLPIQQHVEGMLRESLMKYVGCSCSNAGRQRGLFAIFVGAVVIAIGLIPVLLSVYRGESRGLRMAGLPAFWFGAMTAIAGFHGVCVVIFLFGDARQLYPYELARPILDPLPAMEPLALPVPATTPGQPKPQIALVTRDLSSGDSDDDRMNHNITVSSQYSADDKAMLEKGPSSLSNNTNTTWDTVFPDTAGFIPSGYSPSISSSSTAYSPSIKNHNHKTIPADAGTEASPISPIHFDFDQLPPPTSPRRSYESSEDGSKSSRSFLKDLPNRGVFCKMTKVLSPVVSRAQWEIVMRSSVLGMLVAILFSGIMYALPYHHH